MNDESALEGIAALSNKSRWEIFWLLVAEQCAAMSAGEIGERLKIAPATLSFHLKELTHAGLLHVERSGSRRLYTPDCKIVSAIASYLVDKCDSAKNHEAGDKDRALSERRATGQEWAR